MTSVLQPVSRKVEALATILLESLKREGIILMIAESSPATLPVICPVTIQEWVRVRLTEEKSSTTVFILFTDNLLNLVERAAASWYVECVKFLASYYISSPFCVCVDIQIGRFNKIFGKR